jgi:Rrf2 family protein
MAALQISRKIDYALRAMTYLAGAEAGRALPLGTIASHVAVSPQFLAKIIDGLSRRGLVRARRGSRGGYTLARPADQISFKDVIEAVEGPIMLNTCLDGHSECALSECCRMPSVWRVAQDRLVEVLEQATLASVFLPTTKAIRAREAARAGKDGGVD